MDDSAPESVTQLVPAGAWAIGVSGGADSVALLRLLSGRDDLRLRVVHLDHQTRGNESAADAQFVQQIASQLSLPCTIERRESLEPQVQDLPSNPSARFRRLRLALFERVVREHGLGGVILAHHADDQAETVFQRLLRGSGAPGLAGMGTRAHIGGLLVLRPLVSVRRAQLRRYLNEIGQPWREDASNLSTTYQRNRVRRLLEDRESLVAALLEVSRACRALREWSRSAAPVLAERFGVGQLAELPEILARESARRWLAGRGVPQARIDTGAILRLLAMSRDAATSPVEQFPGAVVVRRRRGEIFGEK